MTKPFPNKKYNIIYADPPWSYNGGLPQRQDGLTPKQHYPVMETEEICALPVDEIADDNSILLMWSTFSKLQDGLDVIKAWGFIYKTCAFAWVKTNKRKNVDQISFLPEDSFSSFWGMGGWTRSNIELCLLGTKGKPKRYSKGVHQVIYSSIREHSRKPDVTKERIIELCGDLPRIELFAREKTEGWDVWGNEVN